MLTKFKPKKCRRCRTEFTPKKEWQKFCGARCRVANQNAKRTTILRKAQRIIDQQEKGAA